MISSTTNTQKQVNPDNFYKGDDCEAFHSIELKRLYRSDGVSNVLFNYSAITIYYNGWFQAFCVHWCSTWLPALWKNLGKAKRNQRQFHCMPIVFSFKKRLLIFSFLFVTRIASRRVTSHAYCNWSFKLPNNMSQNGLLWPLPMYRTKRSFLKLTLLLSGAD